MVFHKPIVKNTSLGRDDLRTGKSRGKHNYSDNGEIRTQDERVGEEVNTILVTKWGVIRKQECSSSESLVFQRSRL